MNTAWNRWCRNLPSGTALSLYDNRITPIIITDITGRCNVRIQNPYTCTTSSGTTSSGRGGSAGIRILYTYITSSNSISCLARKRCCLSPLGEVVSQCYDVFVASWCFRKWSDKVNSHLTPKFGPDWNWVEGASSFIQLFVVPLTLLTGLNLRVRRAQLKGGDLDYCDIENSFAVHMQYRRMELLLT